MAKTSHWWNGILARSLFAVVGIAIFLGGGSSLMVEQSIGEREQTQAVRRLVELLDTVESTASVASFANDEQLAAEVAQGLLRNHDVMRVTIRTGERVLALAERGKPHAGRTAQRAGAFPKVGAGDTVGGPAQIIRSLSSPFKPGEMVGEIVLEADWPAINAQAAENARDTTLLLAWQLVLVAAAVAATMFYLVVRPIKATSDRLHRLDATSGKRLEIPEGHDATEIGRLVDDINDLTGRLVDTLEQERALQHQQGIAQRKYQDLFEHAGSGIFLSDRDGRIESFNRTFVDLTWLPRHDEIRDRRLDEIGWREPQRLRQLLQATLDGPPGQRSAADDFLMVGRRGDERWLHVAIVSLGDGSAQGTITDVTERKKEEISARRLAITDSLTGFANRAGLQAALCELGNGTPAFALAMLDLDGFKQINDAMGFPVGDQLLLMVAARIRAFLGKNDSAARIGGDEFAIVIKGNVDRAAVGERIERLLALLDRPYMLGSQDAPEEIAIGASIGVAFHPADGTDLQQLLRGAELAQSSAKRTGGHVYRYFDPALLAAVEHRRRLEDDLRHALGAGELSLAFQPIVDLAAGRLAGAEALLRWSHPVRGMVSPEVFIPLAEQIGLIGEIGLKVLVDACRQVAHWRQAGLDMYVSVNVSARQIPDALPPQTIDGILRQYGLPVDALAIEITEGVLMGNVATAQTWIESLRSSGLRIYLDDFGTGYSSLSYLKRFPMDTVKIDKSFIRDLGADNSDRTLVDAIVTMAASLGLKVVAEGVETEAQLEILRQLGCGFGQGYLFSRPVKAEDFQQVAASINATLNAGQ